MTKKQLEALRPGDAVSFQGTPTFYPIKKTLIVRVCKDGDIDCDAIIEHPCGWGAEGMGPSAYIYAVASQLEKISKRNQFINWVFRSSKDRYNAF